VTVMMIIWKAISWVTCTSTYKWTQQKQDPAVIDPEQNWQGVRTLAAGTTDAMSSHSRPPHTWNAAAWPFTVTIGGAHPSGPGGGAFYSPCRSPPPHVMEMDRIRTDIIDIIFVFIFLIWFEFEYG
jgi:hypothetical protein